MRSPVGRRERTAMRAALVLLAGLALAAVPPARAEELVAGRDEATWRDTHDALASEVELGEARVAGCEKSEAPRAYDGVAGYVIHGRDGRPRWVAVKRCDEERAALAAARDELERFEERARHLGVPPGWLR